jgi:hypothetical protein
MATPVSAIAVDGAPAGVCLARPAGVSLRRRILAAVRCGSSGHPAVAALLAALGESGQV